jgi:SAM-dependent methyltransferase
MNGFRESIFNKDMGSLNLAQKAFLVYEKLGKEYLIYDKNWGDDLDIIKNTVCGKKGLVMLDAGCGPSWHLEECAKMPNFDHLIGIDYSPRMFKDSQQRLFLSNLDEKVRLIQSNIVRGIPLPSRSVNLIICFNNVLGNLLKSDIESAFIARKKAIAEFNRILCPEGYLIISILNKDNFSQNNGYGKGPFRVDLERSNIEKGDFVVLYKTADGWECSYFSHWFEQKEIVNLLTSFGIEVIELLKREKRLIVIARKR